MSFPHKNSIYLENLGHHIVVDICMALCFLSYTIFIIAMIATVRGKGWSQQEAEWDDYNSNFFWIEYENKVWNPWLG